ncbi:MAG: acyl-ACP--UDP-N-acetylglucosamine O-acyltransferase [Pirellulales bacterium]
MPPRIAETAVVDSRAELGADVEIGPFCIVGPEVVIGPGTRLASHVVVEGRTTIGAHNRIFPHVVIGAEPQDVSYQGEPTQVFVGDHNVIREGVTINRATMKEDGVTVVGSHCYFMANCHVAHDCRLGDRIIMANGTLLGGHVHIHDDATLSGGIGVHHFTTIGSFSFVSGLSRVLQDVPPYMLVEGIPARPRCVNVVALQRNQFPADVVEALAEAYRLLYRARVGLDHARELLRAQGQMAPAVNHLLAFVQNQQEGRHGRGRERRRNAA